MSTREKIMGVAVGVLLMAVLFLVWFNVFHDPQVCRAKAIEIVDDAGNRRAVIGVSPEGAVGIGMFDRAGRLRYSAGLMPDGSPVVVGNNEKGEPVWSAPGTTLQDHQRLIGQVEAIQAR